MDTLHELFEVNIKELCYAEKHVAKAFGKLAKKATSEKLAEALSARRDQSESRIERLKTILHSVEARAKPKKSTAVRGLVDDVEDCARRVKDRKIRDVAILAVAQSAEAYGISRYETLKVWAEQLGLTEASQLIDEILRQQKTIGGKLSELAAEIISDAPTDIGIEFIEPASDPRMRESKPSELEEHGHPQ